MPLLRVRDLASGEAQHLAGTEDVPLPFWSPDSSDLGFFNGVSLKRVSASGGPGGDYMATYGGAGDSWSSDGRIVFSGHQVTVKHQKPVYIQLLPGPACGASGLAGA